MQLGCFHRGIPGWAFVLALTFTCAALTKSPAFTIAENGKAKVAIVIDSAATSARRQAAEDLAKHLVKITGGDFKVQFSPAEDRPNILVGQQAVNMIYPELNTEGLGTDGIVIRTADDNLLLFGGEPRGTLYAVYSFLDNPIGCRWWAQGASTLPSIPTLVIGDMDVKYVPLLEYRDFQFKTTGAWAARNKMNGYEQPLESIDGKKKFNYIAHNKWSSHTFWTLLPPEIYYEDHPEYYSLIDGKRVHSVPKNKHTSLCLTNEKMRKELVKNCRLALWWHPWADLFSISQVDEGGEPNRCMCGPCTAAEEEDNPSGLIVQFVNSVVEDLKKEFPDVTYQTLAYHYSQAPPKKTRPRDDVMIQLSSIGCSFNTPMYESRDDNPRHNQFHEDLVGWSKVCNRLYVWDYAVNFTYHRLPHPNLRTFGKNIRFMVEHNVTGLLVESDTPGCEMPELRAWLMARMMWNPYLDAQDLIEEFCKGFYGPMGEHLLAYVNLMHDAVEASGDYLNLSSPPDAKFLSIENLTKAWQILDEAEVAANGHPAYLARLRNPRESVLYAFVSAFDRLRKEAEETGTEWPLPETQLEINDLLDPPGPLAVLTLPEKWKFKADAGKEGLSKRWFEGEADTSWVPISVMDDWTSQGHDYHGSAWYRTRFQLPADLAGEPQLRLKFGAIDGEALVILNGDTIAELSGHPWDKPVYVDLPPDLDLNEDHQLAVQVTKNQYAAGIWKPVRIVK